MLVDCRCFIGKSYFSKAYQVVASCAAAEELLAWYAEQPYRRPNALGSVVRLYGKRGQLGDAFRVALAFPYLEAARALMRRHNDAAIEYYTHLLGEEFEPYNAVYALGYAHLEGGNDDEAGAYFEAAMEVACSEPRRKDISARLAEIRARREG